MIFRKHSKKVNQVESSLNYSQYGDTNTFDGEMNTNSNTNMTSVDESYLHEDHSQSLTFENFNNIINMNMSENFMQSTF